MDNIIFLISVIAGIISSGLNMHLSALDKNRDAFTAWLCCEILLIPHLITAIIKLII